MTRYWVISPYEIAWPEEWERVWEYDLRNNMISIGWRALGDVSALSREQIIARHKKRYPDAKDRAAYGDSRAIVKFYADINVGDVVIARRGRKIIAAVGDVLKPPFYDPKLNAEAYPKGWAYPNHLPVRWRKEPREVAFPKQEFGLQTVHEIPVEKYKRLLGKNAKPADREIFADESVKDVMYFEGGVKTVTVNAYERDRDARRACLAIHGFSCAVCSMSFEDEFGEIGKGFIHVHHRVKLSTRKKKYRLNAKKDLVPVCPNCHAMLHTSDPPLSVEQLQKVRRRLKKLKR